MKERQAGFQGDGKCNSHQPLKVSTCRRGGNEKGTGEVPFHDAGHLCEMAPAGGSDAGSHGQDVSDVCAQEGRVLLQQGAHAHELGTLRKDGEGSITPIKIDFANTLSCSTPQYHPYNNSLKEELRPRPWLFLHHII